MTITWILVAHGSAGKILEIGKDKNVIIKNEFSHPETTKKDQEIHSDRPGRTFQRSGPLRHAMDYNEEPEDHERRVFAKEIANYLAKAHAENRFKKLILVASPSFLGQLRKALPDALIKIIEHQLDKDFLSQNLTDAELVEKIRLSLDLLHL